MDKQRFNELCDQLLERRPSEYLTRRPEPQRRYETSLRLRAKLKPKACEICGREVVGIEIEYNLRNGKRRCNQPSKSCPIMPWSKLRKYK